MVRIKNVFTKGILFGHYFSSGFRLMLEPEQEMDFEAADVIRMLQTPLFQAQLVLGRLKVETDVPLIAELVNEWTRKNTDFKVQE